MTTRRRAGSKRTWMEEAARVMAIARALHEEINPPLPAGVVVTRDTTVTGPSWDILAVADRIASRTEED